MTAGAVARAGTGGGATLARRIGALFSMGVLGQLAAIAAGVTQAHAQGPAGKAVLAYAIVALSLVLIGGDGIGNAVVMQAGRSKASLGRIHAAMTGIVASIALPCAAIGIVLGFALPSQRPLLGAALAVPFALYAQSARGILLATGATGAVAWQGSITTAFFGAATIAALLVLHVSSYQVLALYAAAQICAAAYTALAVRRAIAQHAGGDQEPLGALIREQFGFGSRSSLATIFGYVNLRIDVFIISATLGPRVLGVYTLAVATGELLWSISLPVVWAALESIAGGTFDEAAALAARLMRGVVALQVMLGILLFIAGPWLIVHIYGAAFKDAGYVMRILLPGLIVYAVETFLGYFILVQVKRPLLLFFVQASSAAVCAVLTLLTLPRFGMAGAAAATTITYCAVVAFKSLFFRHATGIGLRDQWILRRADLQPLYRRFKRA